MGSSSSPSHRALRSSSPMMSRSHCAAVEQVIGLREARHLVASAKADIAPRRCQHCPHEAVRREIWFGRRVMNVSTKRNSGFSLIELVIVVVIIGIIAAIAIPRLSRGSAGAADSAVSGNLAVLRSAVDLFATEHGGSYPTVGTFDSQLTQYTDSAGSFNASKSSTFMYGPYLRKVPTLPV